MIALTEKALYKPLHMKCVIRWCGLQSELKVKKNVTTFHVLCLSSIQSDRVCAFAFKSNFPQEIIGELDVIFLWVMFMYGLRTFLFSGNAVIINLTRFKRWKSLSTDFPWRFGRKAFVTSPSKLLFSLGVPNCRRIRLWVMFLHHGHWHTRPFYISHRPVRTLRAQPSWLWKFYNV